MVTTITSQRASIHIFILRWVLPHLFLNPSSSPCIEGRQAFPCLRDIRIQSKCSWRGIFSLSLRLNQWLHHVSSVASFLPCQYNTPSFTAFPSLHPSSNLLPFPPSAPLLSVIIEPWMKRKASYHTFTANSGNVVSFLYSLQYVLVLESGEKGQ